MHIKFRQRKLTKIYDESSLKILEGKNFLQEKFHKNAAKTLIEGFNFELLKTKALAEFLNLMSHETLSKIHDFK